MKNHLIIWIDSEKSILEIPFWGDLIEKKNLPADKFYPEVSSLFNKHNIQVLYSKEYKPKLKSWSPDEVKSGLNRVFRIILQEDKEFPNELINEISLVPFVKKVRTGDIGVADIPTPVSQSLALPGFDPSSLILLKEAQTFTTGSKSIKIAVLDTGVDRDHPEISHALLPGMDFVDIIDGAEKFIGDYLGYDSDPKDDVGHGTHVCGILAAKGLKMEKGVVPSCKIIPVRVLGALKKGDAIVGAGLIDNINTGIKWAVDQGVDVINMSLGIKHEGGGLPHEQVIKYAQRKGVTIVAASGNDGSQDLYYPGALPGVIAVGAVDNNGQMATFSTYGAHVSFVAPGTGIVSSFPENKYSMSSGTSQASPYVAGAIALLKSFASKFGQKLKDNQVKYILKHTSDRMSGQFKDIKSGYGRINLLDAIKLLKYKLSI
jgi:subtilisin family serine protease